MRIKVGALFHTTSSMLLWKVVEVHDDFVVAKAPFEPEPVWFLTKNITVYAECSKCYPKTRWCRCTWHKEEEHNA